VARLTLADSTPGTAASAFSTRPTQDAHVMPRPGSATSSCIGSYPALLLAAGTAAAASTGDSATCARAAASSTCPRVTPGTARMAFSTRPTQLAQVMPSTGTSSVLKPSAAMASSSQTFDDDTAKPSHQGKVNTARHTTAQQQDARVRIEV